MPQKDRLLELYRHFKLAIFDFSLHEKEVVLQLAFKVVRRKEYLASLMAAELLMSDSLPSLYKRSFWPYLGTCCITMTE